MVLVFLIHVALSFDEDHTMKGGGGSERGARTQVGISYKYVV